MRASKGRNSVRYLIKLFMHCALLFSAMFANVGIYAQSTVTISGTLGVTVTYPLTLNTGWNLLGNSLSTPIDVKTSFGTQANVVTIWKWNAVASTWAFYAPTLDTNGTLGSYATSKGYSVLDTINPGEGYWINSNAFSALGDQSGSAFALNPANLRAGWNLSATGDEVTPPAFSSAVSNVTTLWAWNSANSGWYFYAPSLSASATLASYIASKGYQDFGAATLGGGRGFWVNSTGPVNLAPVTNSGVSQNVATGSAVTLNGAASSDANGDALTYVWTLTSKPAGSTAALANASSAKPTFTADVAGSYVATLVVNDGKLNSTAATITVTAAATTYSATSGVAQKGPLQIGSVVTTQELDAQLSPTGKQYTYQINSDLGTFSPTSRYASHFVDLYATGYYFDEVTNAVSTGTITLNGIADLSTDTTLNVNLLTTLAYQRIKKLVTTQGMRVAAARAQAENEVLAAFNIPNASTYGNFGSLDISKRRDGDNILAAISSLFVQGNTAGNLSLLIAYFQNDIADNGSIDTVATKTTLANSAQTLNAATVAGNLTAKYINRGIVYAATDISNWIDQDGDGVIGKFKFKVANAGAISTYIVPSFVVDMLAGASISLSIGTLTVNGSAVTGAVTINKGDQVSVSPPAGVFPAGVLSAYLLNGSTRVAKVSFMSGLQSIAVTPANASTPNGLTKALTATATFTDGSTQVLSSATWSSNNTSVATVDASGVAKGVLVGTATITATFGGISGSTPLSITAPVLTSIVVSNPSIANGLTQQLTATGVFSDSSTQNITSTVTWSSATPTVATVSAAGIATGISLGIASITATSGTISGNATVTITSAVIQTISLTPMGASLAKGLTQTITAMGNYSDGTAQVLSGAAWTSSAATIASINATGLVTGAGVGTSTITATFLGISGSTSITVIAPVLQGIVVSNPSIAKGLSQQLTATGQYSDTTTQVITNSVTWVAATPSIATVSSTGLATGVALGGATITATSGLISGSGLVTITSPILQSIALTPNAPTVAKGLTQQLTATGTYADASTQTLTGLTWASATTSVATVSGTGLVSTLTQGTSIIRATSGLISGNTTLTVGQAVLTSIVVSGPSIVSGLTQQLTATGVYSDGTTQNITSTVTWSSSNTTIATVVSGGLTSGVATGSVTITATSGFISGNTSLTVTAPPTLQSIVVTPANSNLVLGLTQQMIATGSYSNGTTQNISSSVTWSSSSTANVTVLSTGVATAIAIGSATITATSGAVNGSTVVNTIYAPLTAEVEPNNTSAQANILTPTVALTGQLSITTDQDWYSVTMASAGTITLNFNATTATSATSGWTYSIRNSAGTILSSAVCADYSNCATKTLSAGVAAAGTYYLMVGIGNTSYTLNTSNYAITASTTTTNNTVEIEPNNSLGAANGITTGVALTGQLSSTTDQDWYSVTMASAGTITLNFNATTATSATSGWTYSIRNSAGTILSSAVCADYSNCATKTLSAGVAAAGTYYLMVGIGNTSYTLNTSNYAISYQ